MYNTNTFLSQSHISCTENIQSRLWEIGEIITHALRVLPKKQFCDWLKRLTRTPSSTAAFGLSHRIEVVCASSSTAVTPSTTSRVCGHACRFGTDWPTCAFACQNTCTHYLTHPQCPSPLHPKRRNICEMHRFLTCKIYNNGWKVRKNKTMYTALLTSVVYSFVPLSGRSGNHN